MKKRLWKRLWPLFLVPALLTGCWEAPAPDTDPLIPMEEEAQPEDTRLILPDAFALPYDPEETLDPITCPDGIQQVVGALLYEGLFQLDTSLEPQPRLCSGYTYDPTSLLYTFTLRSGVTFSDGTPLTANDVAVTLRRALGSTRYGARLANVASIGAGDGVVTVVLTSPDTGFPALLDIPIVKAGTESSRVPIGTGAYSYTVDEQGACLTANSSWWGGSQPVDRIVLSPAEDQDAILYQFTSHDVQLITADLTGTSPISASGNVSFQDADTTVFQFVGFNTRRAPFDDSAVRRALGLGIDRDTVVGAFLSGHGEPAQFPVSPVSSLYPEGADVVYSYDAFSEAMAAAGLTSGRTRTVTLLVNAENSFKVSVAEHLAERLSAFDLKLEVQALPWEEYTAALAAGDFDLYYGEVRLTANWDLRALVGSGGTLNYGGWSDPQADQLLAAYAAAEDRAAAMEQLCTYLYQQAPILPVCFKSTSVLFQDGVLEGLTPTMTDPFYDLPSCVIHLDDSDQAA